MFKAKPVPRGSSPCYILHLYAVLLDMQVAAGVLSPDEGSTAPLVQERLRPCCIVNGLLALASLRNLKNPPTQGFLDMLRNGHLCCPHRV